MKALKAQLPIDYKRLDAEVDDPVGKNQIK